MFKDEVQFSLEAFGMLGLLSLTLNYLLLQLVHSCLENDIR